MCATCGGGFGMMDEEFRLSRGWLRTLQWCPLLHVAASAASDKVRIVWPLTCRVEVPPSDEASSRKGAYPPDLEMKPAPQK